MNKFELKLITFKTKFKQLHKLKNKITPEMLALGELQIKNSIAEYFLKVNEINPLGFLHLYEASEKSNFSFSGDLHSEINKDIGALGGLCPKCNAFHPEIFPKGFSNELSKCFCLRNPDANFYWVLNDIGTLGTRLILRNGPHGKFWGCSRFPECTYSCATNEERERNKKYRKRYIGYEPGFDGDDWDDMVELYDYYDTF
jgi:ssDNA-binding Zn-finger/Zn-ribbon topoisomerase 1